ncbi:hypothetical protein CDAR_527881 [Caerostris darwini]|uniref:Uncharacterized protein n=1 Tax=Caerostris darwini TaxID=1538125 RepID=A0AAV4US86_9ARAC|nr:hypothetical protein CDAR_527881 [Caerostris darwini]
MSLNHRKGGDYGMKRSNSLPAISRVFENKGVVKFSSLESINFLQEKNKYSVLETAYYDERRTEECSRIHLHPKAKFSTKLPRLPVQAPETWKQRFLRVSRNFPRSVRRYFRH